MKKVEIIPAILPKDYEELEYKVELIKGFTKIVQVDICDGQFVPSASWPYKKDDDTFAKILREESGMPCWQEVNYEFDLMVNRPEEVVMEWITAGASRIILHVESRGDLEGAIQKIGSTAEIGLAINIETPLDSILDYVNSIQFIQCMGIDKIGFQGQAFDDNVLTKIKQIRTKYPDLTISVDGGVSLENVSKLIEAGATRLVVGSAIFDSDNAIDAVQKFRRISRTIPEEV